MSLQKRVRKGGGVVVGCSLIVASGFTPRLIGWLYSDNYSNMVWALGLEPRTLGLENRCSIQLSYAHMFFSRIGNSNDQQTDFPASGNRNPLGFELGEFAFDFFQVLPAK